VTGKHLLNDIRVHAGNLAMAFPECALYGTTADREAAASGVRFRFLRPAKDSSVRPGGALANTITTTGKEENDP